MSRKHTITTGIRHDQFQDMTALAKLDRRPRASLIRDALDAYLESRRYEIPVEAPDPCQVPMDYNAEAPARLCSCGNAAVGDGRDGRPICLWCRENGEDHPLRAMVSIPPAA